MKKNLIVNLVVAAILVAALAWVYNYQMKNFNRLTVKKTEELKKNAIIEEISKAEKKMFAYKRLLNRKEVSALTSSVNKLASANRVKILAIQPLNEEARDHYIKQGIRLEISANNYHALGNFISALEKSPEIFIVDLLGISPTDITGSGAGMSLKANLIISTYIYKE